MTQREVGSDTDSFEAGVRAAILQDADAIVIGGLEQPAVIEAAFRAVEAGRLVIGRMAAPDASAAIRNLLQRMECEDQQSARLRLAEALHAVVAQKLIPRQNGGRRVLATQLLYMTPYVRETILDAGTADNLSDALVKGRDQYGTQTFDQSLADLVISGEVAFDMAVKLAANPLDLELQLRRRARCVSGMGRWRDAGDATASDALTSEAVASRPRIPSCAALNFRHELTPPGDDLATLLEDGIRYDRSGVSARARACFVEVTERWRASRRPRPPRRGGGWPTLQRLQSQWDEAIASATRSAPSWPRARHERRRRPTRSTSRRPCGRRAAMRRARLVDLRADARAGDDAVTRAKALQNLGGLAAEERRVRRGGAFLRRIARSVSRGRRCARRSVQPAQHRTLQAERGDPALAQETLEAAVHPVAPGRRHGDARRRAAQPRHRARRRSASVAEAEERITTAYGQFTIADIALQRVRCLLQLADLRGGPRRAGRGARLPRPRTQGRVAPELPRELRLIDEQLARARASA